MKLQITLRHRLVMLVVAAIVPLFGLSTLNAWLGADAAASRATDNLNFAVSLVAANQERVASSAHQILMSIANAPGLMDGKAANCQRYLKTLKDQFPIYANLGLIGLDGNFRCHSLGSSPMPFAGDRYYFQQALAKSSFVTDGYFVGRATGKPSIAFAMPVTSSEGKVTAVAFAGVDLNEMSKALDKVALPQGTLVAIMDRQGRVLAASPPNSKVIGSPVPFPLLQDAVKSMRTGIGKDLDGENRRRIFAFRPAGYAEGAAFFVSASTDWDRIVGPVQTRLRLELLALTLLAYLGGWLAWRMGGRAIVRPLEAILDATRQIQGNRLDVRIPTEALDKGGEVAKVAAGFNLMAESLQAHREALEAELARSHLIRGKLQDAQRLGRIGYWQFDVDTRRLWWSDEAYELLGMERTQADITDDRALQLIYPGDREAFNARREAAAQAGQPLDIEVRIVMPDGELRWMHLCSRIHVNAEGEKTTCRSGMIQDITERKRAELAKARSSAVLKRTGELAKVGGWEMDTVTMISYWSDEFYRIFDLDPVSDAGRESSLGFYDPEGQTALRAALKALLQDGIPWDMELPLTTAKGRRLWVRSQGRAVHEGGKVVRFVGALQDLTDQHAAHAHLRLLQTCISHLNDMVMITEGAPISEAWPGVVFVNHAFQRKTGYSPEELVGSTARLLHGPKTQRAELKRVLALLGKQESARTELIHYTKSGAEFWIEVDIVPVSDGQGGIGHWVSVGRDITQRKLSEQALIDSEQRYAVLFEAAPVPMWVHDPETARFLMVNSAAVQCYGYSVAEFLSMTLFDIRPPKEHWRLRQHLAAGAPLLRTVGEHRRKDGSIFPVEGVSQPIQYEGRSARFVVLLDMTAQVNAEKELQSHLSTLQRAADAAQAITWHQTLEGTLQEIAAQARGVIGSHQAVVSLGVNSAQEQAVHALSLSDKYASYRNLRAPPDGRGIYALLGENNRSIRLTQAELEAHPHWRGLGSHADKHPAMRGWLAVPLRARDGQTIGLLQLSDKYEGDFTQQDEYVAVELAHLASAALENSRLLGEVSQLNAGLEQKVAERTAALARQEALFRVLAEQAPQVVWTADPRGGATYFNRAWLELVGGERQDWLGYQWFSTVHPEDLPDVKAAWQTARANQSRYMGVRRVLSQDGVYHTMAYRASPVFDEGGKLVFWVGIDADITEGKATEAALRLANQELEAFSYSVSHDLRSPLNTVDGFSRLLAKQLAPHLAGAAAEKAQHYLARIQAGVAQMGQLIEDLLSLAQVARAQLHSEPVDISGLAAGILEELQARQPERQVAVHLQSGLQARGDGRLLKVAMENLLANAWKFTSQKDRGEISVGQEVDTAGLPVFFVRDNGAGFDMAYADKLFNPFQRLHAASEFLGTGVGLATVSRVIGRHGGRLWAESAPGCGATFFFTLPKVPLTA